MHHAVPGARKNALGWDIAPFGLHRLLLWVHKRYAFIRPPGATRREDNLKVEQSVGGFELLRKGREIRFRAAEVDGALTVVALAAAQPEPQPEPGRRSPGRGGLRRGGARGARPRRRRRPRRPR